VRRKDFIRGANEEVPVRKWGLEWDPTPPMLRFSLLFVNKYKGLANITIWNEILLSG
jgi:hypothetical protein